MALTTCPHCGKPVSDRAVKCPHCGCNPKETSAVERLHDVAPEPQHNTPIVEEKGCSTNYGKIIIIVLAVIILAVGGFLGYKIYGPSKTPYVEFSDSTTADSCGSDITEADTVAKFDDTEAKLEEFKNFTSNDLAAFMLHGKVKMIKEGDNRMYFDENGILIKYVDLWGETQIEHTSDGLYIHSQGHGDRPITMRNGKIAEIGFGTYQGITFYELYSNYDANNCPKTAICVEEGIGLYDGEEIHNETVNTIKYSDYDEYGNYRKKIRISDNGTDVSTRTIVYYPIED